MKPVSKPNELDAFKDLLGKATEHQTGSKFVLDKEKYPDVRETPYGFIYNVVDDKGNILRSITDSTAERMTWGKPNLPKENLGFSVDFDGDESFYPDWESAYKAAKGIK